MAKQRDENGRFVKGHSGNPTGRAPRVREERFYQITLSTVTFDDWKEIVTKAVAQAKSGDDKARKFLADYLIGPPTQKTDISVTDKRIVVTIEEPEEEEG
ncbi:MAG: DUF5681 domain-containing protein [Anaerolineaceae bacterium]